MSRSTRAIKSNHRAVRESQRQRREAREQEAMRVTMASAIEGLAAMSEFFRTASQERADIVAFLDDAVGPIEINNDPWNAGYRTGLQDAAHWIEKGVHRNV